VNIALMHTSLAGSPGHDHYAPCSPADLDTAGFDYWALGHIHKRSATAGRSTVVMPGMPQGRDINESGPKSVTLVTIADDRSVHLAEHLTSVAQFEPIEIDLTGIDDWQEMTTALAKSFQRVREQIPSEHLVARLRFTGTTSLAWRLRRDRDLLYEEAQNRASVLGKAWIDKIEIDAKAPGATSGPAADPILELRRCIAEDIVHSASYQEEIAVIADELRSQLPPECRGFLGTEETAFQSILRLLAAEGSEDVLARLHASSVTEAS
jgi:DNA repair exonuclease SbcCD nuclease subunit